jgi:hypothetical protein
MPMIPQIKEMLRHPERVTAGYGPSAWFASLTCLLAAGWLLLGPYPITIFPEDTGYYLLQGDLLLRGYRPGIDFHSMVGPFPGLFSALGIAAEGVTLDAVILAQLVGAVLFGTLYFWIALGRVNGVWAVGLAICVELLLVACTPLGKNAWREFSCAMWYNLIGYCAYAIVFLYLLVPSRRQARSAAVADILVVAFALMACFLTKLSYFLPCFATFLAGALVFPPPNVSRVRGAVILVSAAVMTLAVLASLEGSLQAPFSLLSVLKLKVSPVMPVMRFAQFTRMVGLFALGAALVAWYAYEANTLRQMKRTFLLLGLIFASYLAAAGTSAQDLELMPMSGAAILAAVVVAVRLIDEARLPRNKYLQTSALAIALLLVVHEPKNSLLSWGFSHAQGVKTIASRVITLGERGRTDASPPFAPNVPPDVLAKFPAKWADKQLQAVELLHRGGVRPEDAVFVAADVSPAVMLSGVRYAKSTITWWPGVWIDQPESIELIDDQLFVDADYILRDTTCDMFWRYLMHHRRDYVEQHFEESADLGAWKLYARRQE